MIARPVRRATVAIALVAVGAGGLTIKLKLELLVALAASVTVTVSTVLACETVAVPVIWPVAVLNESPAGKVGEIAKVYGAVPPIAVTGFKVPGTAVP